MNFIGIDPGRTGAICVINEYRQGLIIPMPYMERDLRDTICNIVTEYLGDERPSKKGIVGIEYEHAFPGRGACAAWTFATHYGFLRGVFTALDVQFEEVGVGAWMKACCVKRVKGTDPKRKYWQTARARLWFPHMKVSKDHADAVLIAEYLRRTWTHEPDEVEELASEPC